MYQTGPKHLSLPCENTAILFNLFSIQCRRDAQCYMLSQNSLIPYAKLLNSGKYGLLNVLMNGHGMATVG